MPLPPLRNSGTGIALPAAQRDRSQSLESKTATPSRPRQALLCVQAFPPLLKAAGGASRRHLSLCRALIDGLGWHVTLLTPVALFCAGEPEVDRWLNSGQLQYLPAKAMEVSFPGEGRATFLDLLSAFNTRRLAWALLRGRYDLCLADDIPLRLLLCLLARAAAVPTVLTTHGDFARFVCSHWHGARVFWRLHLLAADVATLHAASSEVFAETLRARYRLPVAAWPPMLWCDTFLRPRRDFERAAGAERGRWLRLLGYSPKHLLLAVGRWSPEKRLHLLVDALPPDCALVLIGDGTGGYAEAIESLARDDVLPLRGMVSAIELRVAYSACDMLVSASDSQAAVVEAICAGTPVAVQPAPGLSYIEHQANSYRVNFSEPEEARGQLSEILTSGALERVRPGLSRLGEQLRRRSLQEDLDVALLQPSLAAAEGWTASRLRRWLCQPLLRGLCALLWLQLWLLCWCFCRAYYRCCREPRFCRLGRAGMVTEPRPGSVPAVRTKDAWGTSSAWCSGSESTSSSSSLRTMMGKLSSLHPISQIQIVPPKYVSGNCVHEVEEGDVTASPVN